MGQTEQSNCVRSRTTLVYLHLKGWLGLWWCFDLQPLSLKGPAQQPRAQRRCSGTPAPAQSHYTGVPCTCRQCTASWAMHRPAQQQSSMVKLESLTRSLVHPHFPLRSGASLSPQDLLYPSRRGRGPDSDLPPFPAPGLGCASAPCERTESLFIRTSLASTVQVCQLCGTKGAWWHCLSGTLCTPGQGSPVPAELMP